MAEKFLSLDDFLDRFDAVVELLEEEVKYARTYDEQRNEGKGLPGGSALYDSEKPVEFWIKVMEEKLKEASAAAVGSMDKTKALDRIRAAAGVAFTCMIHNETPPRK